MIYFKPSQDSIRRLHRAHFSKSRISPFLAPDLTSRSEPFNQSFIYSYINIFSSKTQEKRALGAKKGDIAKSIAKLEEVEMKVPKSIRAQQDAINKEIDRLNKEFKKEKGKSQDSSSKHSIDKALL